MVRRDSPHDSKKVKYTCRRASFVSNKFMMDGKKMNLSIVGASPCSSEFLPFMESSILMTGLQHEVKTTRLFKL